MSTQTALQSRIVFPPVGDIVESLERAANAAVNFEVVKAPTKQVAHPMQRTASPWLQPATAEPVSRFGKSGVFAIVVLIHALGFYALSKMPSQVKAAILEPLQIVLVDAPEAPKELPPPPVPVLRPDLSLPIEPVINIAEPENTKAITVATLTEPTNGAPQSYGTPKVVSSVEYIREPAAKYPSAARALKQRGTVTLRCLVGIDGKANEVNVYRSSGSHLLDDAARTAVLNAVFKPYTENGHVIPVYVLVPIEFGTPGAKNSAS
jgi:periplasmic protein TonB